MTSAQRQLPEVRPSPGKGDDMPKGTCSEDGCELQVRCRSLCDRHYRAFMDPICDNESDGHTRVPQTMCHGCCAERARPFRHLCPEADRRDAMTDAEFWDDVARSLSPPQFDASDLPGWEPDWNSDDLSGWDPCPTCGGIGACGYDDRGRPMIHLNPKVDP